MQSFLTSETPDIKENPDTLYIRPDKSIGISEIRAVRSFLSKKPMQSSQNTVIIHDAHLLTHDAQQAFLKTLEEPPEHALIYLVTSYPDQLIPTILSRVQNLSHQSQLPDQSDPHSQELFQKLISVGVGDRLLLLDKEEFTRESALKFLDDLESILHSQINQSSPSLTASDANRRFELREGLGESYEKISLTRKYLKANVSVRLAMDNFVINL